MSKPWSVIGGIVDWSLKYRLLVLAVAAVVLFLGIGSSAKWRSMSIPNSVLLSSRSRAKRSGCRREEVAEMVAVPLEADLLSNVPFVDILSSKSVPGLSSIEMVFEPGTELLEARQVVQERLAEAMVALPEAAKPPRAATAFRDHAGHDDRALLEGSLAHRHVGPGALEYRPRLMGIPRVANVAIWSASAAAASGPGRS